MTIDATPITQELANVITAIIGVGGAVLIVYQLRNSFGFIRDALFSLRDGMTDDEHYDHAYRNFTGASF